MSELFSNDNIFINQTVKDQNEAIEKAGQALVSSGAVTEDYIQAMKDREQVVTTFMGNGLAIPHGTDEAKTSVLKSGLTLIQIPDGVDWDGEEVKVVVGIAGKDGEHLDLLSKLLSHLVKKKMLNALSMLHQLKKLNKYLRRLTHNESITFWCG